MQALYDELADSKGLRILAFPCNQFGSQVCDIVFVLVICVLKEMFIFFNEMFYKVL